MANNERLIAEVGAMRAKGLSLRATATAAGVSHPSVLRLLTRRSPELSYRPTTVEA
jgi:lambda repressor-like predicted transcriptional regulator